MSKDELESLREQKRQKIVESKDSADSKAPPDTDSEAPPDEPIYVESVEHFSKVTTDYDAVLVDFYADWCGPCNMLEPTVASIAANTDAAVAKVDIDQHQGLATQYGVRSVPTLVLFADGKQVEQVVGVQDEATLTKLVERDN